jgi:hypothetical protein
VENYIQRNFNVQVTCNGGHDVPISSGKTFTCTGGGRTFTVRLTDNKGTYQVAPG